MVKLTRAVSVRDPDICFGQSLDRDASRGRGAHPSHGRMPHGHLRDRKRRGAVPFDAKRESLLQPAQNQEGRHGRERRAGDVAHARFVQGVEGFRVAEDCTAKAAASFAATLSSVGRAQEDEWLNGIGKASRIVAVMDRAGSEAEFGLVRRLCQFSLGLVGSLGHRLQTCSWLSEGVAANWFI